MDLKLLIDEHPTLYHMAEPGTWPSISKYGLFSTEALLDHLRAKPEERRSILLEHRPQTRSCNGVLIRDQKPMSYSKLHSALKPAGIEPQQWFAFLNRKVFFWATHDRLQTFRAAYKFKRQLIIEVQTKDMVEAHSDEITLCHINSGAVRMPNHYRSFESFQSIRSFAKKKPAELTIAHAVKDIADLACRVSEVGGSQPEIVLYSK